MSLRPAQEFLTNYKRKTKQDEEGAPSEGVESTNIILRRIYIKADRERPQYVLPNLLLPGSVCRYASRIRFLPVRCQGIHFTFTARLRPYLEPLASIR